MILASEVTNWSRHGDFNLLFRSQSRPSFDNGGKLDYTKNQTVKRRSGSATLSKQRREQYWSNLKNKTGQESYSINNRRQYPHP